MQYISISTKRFLSTRFPPSHIQTLSYRHCSTAASIQYCMDIVKKHDFENYLIGLLTPSSGRSEFYVIHAYNVEIALIQSSVRGNISAAKMRYKWWNDLISKMYDGTVDMANVEHPVVRALDICVREKNISRRWLESVVEARQQDMINPQPESLSDLESRVERSHSSLLYLTMEAQGIASPSATSSSPVEHMASHIGVAFGIVSTLRGTAVDISQGSIRLPVESLLAQSLPSSGPVSARDALISCREKPTTDPTSLFDEVERAAFKEVVFDTASQAFGHLDRARELFDALPSDKRRECIYTMLPGVVAGDYLQRLRDVDFNPLHPSLVPKSHLMILIKLLKSSLFAKL